MIDPSDRRFPAELPTLEGVHRQCVIKSGVFEDLARYAILAAEAVPS